MQGNITTSKNKKIHSPFNPDNNEIKRNKVIENNIKKERS